MRDTLPQGCGGQLLRCLNRKILATELDDSSSISETHTVKGEAIPTSCPLTPTAHCGM